MTGNVEQANSVWEKWLKYLGVERWDQARAAYLAEHRDYHISAESQAALDRGDAQRKTGIYQNDPDTLLEDYAGQIDNDNENDLARFSDEGNPHG